MESVTVRSTVGVGEQHDRLCRQPLAATESTEALAGGGLDVDPVLLAAADRERCAPASRRGAARRAAPPRSVSGPRSRAASDAPASASRSGAGTRGCRRPSSAGRCPENAARCLRAPSRRAAHRTARAAARRRPNGPGFPATTGSSPRPASRGRRARSRARHSQSPPSSLPPRPQDRFRDPTILHVRELDIVGTTANQQRPEPQHLDGRRLVRDGALALETERQCTLEQAVAEHLRRERAPQSLAHRGAGAAPVTIVALERVGDRNGEQSPDRVIARCPISRARSSLSRHGRAASCTMTQSVSCARPASDSSAFATDASRRSPPRQVLTRGSRDSASRRQRRSPGASATTMPSSVDSRSSAPSDQESTGRPSRLTYCLGIRPPKRWPRPAATTTAQRRARTLISARPGRSVAALPGPGRQHPAPAARPGRRSRRRRSCRGPCARAPRSRPALP